MKKPYLFIEQYGSPEELSLTVKTVAKLLLKTVTKGEAYVKIYDPGTKKFYQIENFLSVEDLDQNRVFLIRLSVENVMLQSWTIEIEVAKTLSLFGVLDYIQDGDESGLMNVYLMLESIPGLKVSIP